MSSRKVPPRATSRLDLASHVPPPVAPVATPEVPLASAPKRARWLADMMTPDQNSFGVMRLLLALAVLVSHAVYLTTGKGELEPLYGWTNYTLGQHGVQVFFFLSGILVAQSLFQSGSVRDYATARALRVFPALIACVLITAIGVGLAVTTLPSATYLKDQGVAAYIAKTISLWSGSGQLPGVFQNNTVPNAVNTSVWTLKYEALCYALLAVAGFIVMKMQRWREAAFAFIALWAALVIAKPVGLELHGGAKSTLQVLHYFTIFFGTGVVAYACRHCIPVHVMGLLPLGALFVYAIGTRFQEGAAAVFLGYLAIWLSTFRFGGLRAFTNQSDYSYATYLYHMPVAQVLLHLWPDMHVASLILATTGITIWLAFFSWELIERPALALRHTLWKKEPHSAEAAFDAAMATAKAAKGSAFGDAVAAPAAAREPEPRATSKPIEAPLPVTPAKLAAAAAAAASARASERLAREFAAAKRAAATSPALPTPREVVEAANERPAVVAATPAVVVPTPIAAEQPMAAVAAAKTEPGTAQVWRPMPVVRKLKIHAEDAADLAPPAAGISRRLAMPLDLIKKATGAAPAPEPKPETPLPRVPASRIAFATKRSAAADAPRIEEPAPAVAAEPSRAVVAVGESEISADLGLTRRYSQPRPAWTPPLAKGPQPA